jgi:hypothetical protein
MLDTSTRTPKGQDHFYTLETEILNEKLTNYTRVGIACHVSSKKIASMVPLRRYFHRERHDHFYCVAPEKENLKDWVEERSMGFVIPPDHRADPRFAPLHRYVNDELHDHLYTLTYDEEVFLRMGYRYERVACLVFKKPEEHSVPLVLYVRGKSVFEKHLLLSMHAHPDGDEKSQLSGEGFPEHVVFGPEKNDFEKEQPEDRGVNKEEKRVKAHSQGTSPAMRDFNIPPALGVEGIAEDMAALLSKNITSEKGNMVGIFGEWGRGKSYLIRKIREHESITENFLTIEYHAWKYQDTPASWAYLYEEFAKKYFEKESGSKFSKKCFELCQAFRLNRSIHGNYPIVLTVLGGIIFFVGLYLRERIEPLLEVLYWITLGGAGVVFALGSATYVRYKKTASDLFAKYFHRSKFNELMGAQAEIQKELAHLLEHWFPVPSNHNENEVPTYKRVLLVIEDIDRCSEDKIIEIVDALRVMMDDPVISKRIVVLAAIDERILKRAINAKYHSTLNQDPCLLTEEKEDRDAMLHALSESIVHEYMDKLFIAGVKLGSLGEQNRLEYFDKLVENATILESEQPEKETSGLGSGAFGGMNYGDGTIPEEEEESEGPESVEQEEVTDYELRSEELAILRQCISGFHKATPRKIRIFYYRYVLGRTLMRRRGVSTVEDLEAFALQLVKESNTHHSSETTDSSSPNNREAADLNPVIRECLDMVVAY